MENKLYDNYKKSLEQKYNAACIDIDGTLTEKIYSPSVNKCNYTVNCKT